MREDDDEDNREGERKGEGASPLFWVQNSNRLLHAQQAYTFNHIPALNVAAIAHSAQSFLCERDAKEYYLVIVIITRVCTSKKNLPEGGGKKTIQGREKVESNIHESCTTCPKFLQGSSER